MDGQIPKIKAKLYYAYNTEHKNDEEIAKIGRFAESIQIAPDARRGEGDEEDIFVLVDRVAGAPQQSKWSYLDRLRTISL
jgi:hypothetical protein